MKNIKLVVKENLIKKYQLQESVNAILLEENNNRKFNMTIHHLGRLIDEGYNEEQLHQHLNEQFDWLRKMFGGNDANPKDIANHNAVLKTSETGAWNQLKQWGIRKFLGALGLDSEGPMAYAISMAFTDMSLMDIISIFRDRQGCISHSDNVARGVIDAAVAAMRADAGPNSVFGNFLQNTISQTLYDKGLFRKIGTSVCNMVYGKTSKSLLPKAAQDAVTPSTNTTSNSVKTPQDDDYQFKPDFSKDTSPLS